MSYQVLARKWRPRSFETLVGQEHVVKALTHALDHNRLHHAYLFTGTRGVGKTTIARILAKSLNCDRGVSAHPCGECDACREIDAGRFVDLLEVDAATNTRVDEMRQLLENAVYAPTRGRYKVYVIDEVHMLSNSAFNAMLKTLEEPPEHVKFILATTDPQKIPVTVLSRCLQFNLKNMPEPAIVGHLERILKEEGIAFDQASLHLIAHSSGGSMRDSLSLLDQAIAHGAGKVEADAVGAMLGTVDQAHLYRLVEALIIGQVSDLQTIAEEMLFRSFSFDQALKDLAQLAVRLQAIQLGARDVGIGDPGEAERLSSLAGKLAPDYVQLLYQTALLGRRDLPLAPDAYAGFLMTLFRLLAFRPARPGDTLFGEGSPKAGAGSSEATRRAGEPVAAATAVQRAEGTEAARGAPVSAVPEPAAPPLPALPSVISSALPPNHPVHDSPPWDDDLTERQPAELETAPERRAQTAPPAPKPLEAVSPKPVGGGNADGDWHSIVTALGLNGLAQQLAQNAELVARREGEVKLRLPPAQRHLLMKASVDKLQQALAEYWGEALRVSVDLADTTSETPAALAQRQRRELQDQATQSIEQDEFVREAIQIFDATLIQSSIRPL